MTKKTPALTMMTTSMMTLMTKFEELLELLEEITHDPTLLPHGDDIEEMIFDAAEDWSPTRLEVKTTLLSLMVHNAALQGYIDLLSRGEDPTEIFTVH